MLQFSLEAEFGIPTLTWGRGETGHIAEKNGKGPLKKRNVSTLSAPILDCAG